MTTSKIQDGTQIATVLLKQAHEAASGHKNAASLADILSRLNSNPTSQTPMLRSTAGKIAAYLGKPIDQISLDLIHARREGFRPFLERLRHKEGAIRAYVNYLRILLETAEELGWRPLSCVSPDWLEVLSLAKQSGCLAIAKYHSQTRSSPSDVTAADTDSWLDLKMKQGTKYVSAKTNIDELWRILGKRSEIPSGSSVAQG